MEVKAAYGKSQPQHVLNLGKSADNNFEYLTVVLNKPDYDYFYFCNFINASISLLHF